MFSRRSESVKLEDRGFEIASSVGATRFDAISLVTCLGLGAAVTLWHGTRTGGFSRFYRSPTYFAFERKNALPYAKQETMGAQRVPRGARGVPEIVEAYVDPGRTLDINTPEGERDLKTAIDRMFENDPEGKPPFKALLQNSESYRGGYRSRAVPFWLVDNGLGKYLQELGYDSTYVSESHHQSLAVFDPKGRTKIVGRASP